MPSTKRSRAFDDEDGEVEIESASSSFQSSSFPKRPRVALARENGGSTVSDDEEDDDTQTLQDDIQSDTDGDNEIDDDELEIQGTQAIGKQMRQHQDNVASEHGIIEEVFCRNFMCHSKLRIRLGPLINFIIGHNGSGKSAVLTALTMCLGGKATASNRGANLKSLIKTGQESAMLAVTIKNQGEGAYKPELYGHSITVERHFSRSSGSGFKLKNAQQKIVSTKRADLDDILDYFAFQLDNPINVLSQDMARQFLSNSTPTEKYKFFIKGTQLEALDHDYKVMEDSLDGIEEILRVREDDLDTLNSKVREAEEKKRQIDNVRNIQGTIKKYQNMHAWAQVVEQEEKLQRYERDVEVQQDIFREREAEAEPINGAFDGHDQAFTAAEQFLETQQATLGPAKQEYETANAAWQTHYAQVSEAKAEQRNIKESINSSKNTITRLRGDIGQEEERLAGVHGTAHQDRLARLEELKQEAEDAKHAQSEHSKKFLELETSRQKAEQEHEAAKPAHKDAGDTLKQAENNLRQLQASSNNAFAGYHESVSRAVKEIDRETRWRAKPVGPIGMHIRLLKPEWSSQLETTLGGTLNAFAVTNKEDQVILSQILRRCNCHAQIYICRPEPLDTTGKEPEEGVDTMLRVLRIDNNLIRNTLIINTAIDQTVLIKDQQEAYRFTYEGGQRPHNVRAVICHAPERGAGVRMEYTRMGQQKISPVQKWRGQPRLKADREEQLRHQRQVVEQAKQDEDDARQRVAQLQRNLTKANQAVVRFKREKQDLVVASQRADEAVETMQAEIDNNRPQDGRLQELQKQLQDARADLANNESAFGDSVIGLDRIDEAGRTLKARLAETDKEKKQVEKNIARATLRKDKCKTDRETALFAKNEAHNAINNAKDHVTRMEGKRDEQRAVVEEYGSQASALCARVRVEEGMTPAKLDERIDKLERDYKRIEANIGGTREELHAAWQKAVLEFETAKKQTAEMVTCAKVRRPSSYNARQILTIEHSPSRTPSTSATAVGVSFASTSPPARRSTLATCFQSALSVAASSSSTIPSAWTSTSSLTCLKSPTQVAKPARSVAVRNLSRPSVCC